MDSGQALFGFSAVIPVIFPSAAQQRIYDLTQTVPEADDPALADGERQVRFPLAGDPVVAGRGEILKDAGIVTAIHMAVKNGSAVISYIPQQDLPGKSAALRCGDGDPGRVGEQDVLSRLSSGGQFPRRA